MEQLKTWIAEGNLVDLLTQIGLNLLFAFFIWVFGLWLARRVQKVLEKLLRKRDVDDVLVDFLGTIARFAVIVVAIVAALDKLGIPATSLLAVVGAAGLAVGLALKDSLSNFAAGVMLVLFRPFTRGDFIEAAGVSGKVQEIFLVSTRLLTADNKEVTIPNNAIWSGNIINYSAQDKRRVDLVIGVGYDDDLKVVASVLRKVCAEHPKILKEPETAIFVSNLGESSVDFVVRPWVMNADYWTVYADVLQTAKAELEDAGCSIPYPQRDIHQYVYHPVGEGAH